MLKKLIVYGFVVFHLCSSVMWNDNTFKLREIPASTQEMSERFIKLTPRHCFGLIVPLDWVDSVREDLHQTFNIVE